jgi:hypothetical protein
MSPNNNIKSCCYQWTRSSSSLRGGNGGASSIAQGTFPDLPYKNKSGVNVMIPIFGDFRQFSAKKIGVFLQNQC